MFAVNLLTFQVVVALYIHSALRALRNGRKKVRSIIYFSAILTPDIIFTNLSALWLTALYLLMMNLQFNSNSWDDGETS